MTTGGIVAEGGTNLVGEIAGVSVGIKVAASGVGVITPGVTDAVAEGELQALRQRSRGINSKIRDLWVPPVQFTGSTHKSLILPTYPPKRQARGMGKYCLRHTATCRARV
jgi:hypothetical protein